MTQNQKLSTLGHRHDHHSHEEEHDVIEEIAPAAFVFDASTLGEEVPEGFNAVKITLDGSIKSDLKWEKERDAASRYIERGLRIFWEMRLGLFSQLEKPIANQSQFLSLCLSLEHFRDSLWKEFRPHTIGLCLYRGSPDFKLEFPWDEEQQSNLQDWLKERDVTLAKENENSLLSLFCRDVAGEYLDLLADRLPDTLNCFALLDASGIADPVLRAQLTTKERYPRFVLGIKGINQDAFSWDSSLVSAGALSREPIIEAPLIRIGVCLPPITLCHPSAWEGLGDAMIQLEEKGIPFRTIPEMSLTTEWDGLDYLIVSSENLSPQGRRKLQGFCAAWGAVVTIGAPIGLTQESNMEMITG